MINKLKKLRRLAHSRGIHLKKPWHWIKLIALGFRFIFKHGAKSRAALGHTYESITSDNAASEPPPDEIQTHELIWKRIKPTYSELTKMRWTVPSLKKHYTFTIVIPSQDNNTISSVEKQIYDKYELIIGNIQESITKASGEYVLFLQPGDFLHPNALFELCFELNRVNEMPSFVYFDHNYFVNDTVDKPYYKPGWSPDLILVSNYINRACIFKCDLLKQIQIIDKSFYITMYDIILKLSEFEAGHHKPGILLTIPDDDERAFDAEENFVRSETLARRGINGIIESNKYGVTSLKRTLIGIPKISIIILTCFSKEYIESCIKSIENLTTYNNYEIVVVDNSRKEPDYGINRLRSFNCKILYVNEPFNWSRLNNLGAKEASGDLFLFINDDIELTTSDWLERMAAEAQRPELGMVGPIVTYANEYSNIVQSAGGFKVPHHGGGSHSFFHVEETSPVYHNFLHYTRNTTYVMGACFMIEKNKFNEVGHLDEMLPLECNETDLALRLIEKGYRNLTMAEIKIIHYERASRGLERKEQPSWEYFKKKWNNELQKQDLYLNPYIDSYRNDYSEDLSPTLCRHDGSPTISPELINKVIIVKLDHIGDVILSLPAIRKVRKILPDAQIDILCAPWVKELLEQQPEINHVYCFNLWQEDDSIQKKILAEIKAQKYDLAINLRKYPDTKELTLDLADYCLLFSSKAEFDSISHSVPMIDRNEGNIVKWHFRDQMLSLVNVLEYDNKLNNEFIISSYICDTVNEKINPLPILNNDIIIGIHVGSNFSNRIWPKENFINLCNLIHKRTSANIVLVGDNEDVYTNENVIECVEDKERIMSVAGMFSLTEYIYFVKKLDYFIGNVSGPGHIAGIQGLPTLIISGSRHPSPEWTPIGNSMIVERRTSCGPCYDFDGCPHNECITLIQPGNVFSALERLMILYPSIREQI